MRAWMVIPALVMLAAKSDQKLVLNHARILDGPQYWAHHAGDVERGDKVTILKQEGGWAKVRTSHATGYVPMSAFVDSAVDASQLSFGDSAAPADKGGSTAQAANASRGLGQDAARVSLDKAELQAADHWLDKYEGKENGAKLEKALATGEPGFISGGHLLGGAP